MFRLLFSVFSAVVGLADAMIAEIDRSFASNEKEKEKKGKGVTLAIGPKPPRNTASPPAARFLMRKALDHLEALELEAAMLTASAATSSVDSDQSSLDEHEKQVILDGYNDIVHWICSLRNEPAHRELPANRECREDIRVLRKKYPRLMDPELLDRIRVASKTKYGLRFDTWEG